jgi:predicted kinase
MQLVEYVNSLFEQGLSGEEVIAKTQEWKKKNQPEEEVKIEGVAEQKDAAVPPKETPEASENLESGSGQLESQKPKFFGSGMTPEQMDQARKSQIQYKTFTSIAKPSETYNRKDGYEYKYEITPENKVEYFAKTEGAKDWDKKSGKQLLAVQSVFGHSDYSVEKAKLTEKGITEAQAVLNLGFNPAKEPSTDDIISGIISKDETEAFTLPVEIVSETKSKIEKLKKQQEGLSLMDPKSAKIQEEINLLEQSIDPLQTAKIRSQKLADETSLTESQLLEIEKSADNFVNKPKQLVKKEKQWNSSTKSYVEVDSVEQNTEVVNAYNKATEQYAKQNNLDVKEIVLTPEVEETIKGIMKNNYVQEMSKARVDKNIENWIEDNRGIFTPSQLQKQQAVYNKINAIDLSAKQKNALNIVTDSKSRIDSIRQEKKKLSELNFQTQDEVDEANEVFRLLNAEEAKLLEIYGENFEKSNELLEGKNASLNRLDLLERNYSYTANFLNSIKTAGLDMALGAEELVYRIADAPNAFNFSDDKNFNAYSILSPLASIQMMNYANNRKEVIEAVDNYKEGIEKGMARPQTLSSLSDGQDWGRYLASTIGSQIPNTVMLVSGGGAALPIMGGVSAGSSFREMQKEMDENPLINYTPGQMYTVAMLNGAAEVISERISLGIINRAQKAYNIDTGIKKGFVDQLKSAFTKEGFKKLGTGAIEVTGESVSEGGVELSSNIFDRYILGKEVDLFEGVTDAMFSGLIMSAGVYKAPNLFKGVVNMVQGPDTNQKLSDNYTKIKEAEAILANNIKMSKTNQAALQNKINKLVQDSSNEINKTLNRFGTMPIETVRELSAIELEQFKVRKQLEGFESDPNMSEDAKKELVRTSRAELQELGNKKQKILEPIIKADAEAATAEQVELNTRKIEAEVETIKKFAGEGKVNVFETASEFTEATGIEGDVDAFIDPETNEIFINKEWAAKVGAVTVGSHELLHKILKSTFAADSAAAMKLVEDFKGILSSKELNIVQKRIDENYADADDVVKAEEYLTAFSDAIGKGELKWSDNLSATFMRLARPILNIFKGKGFTEMEFKTGRDVYDFIKDYQSNIKKGKVSERGQKLAAKAESTIAEDIKTSISKGEIASNEVQNIYKDQGVSGAMDIIQKFKPITNRIVEARSQAPNFDRQLLTDEIETGPRGILDLIMEYKPESGVPLAAYINKFLPARAIESSRRVLGEEFTTDVTEAKGVVAEETTAVETKEKPIAKKPTETVEFSQAQVEKIDAKDKAEVETRITEATKKAFKGQDIKTFGKTRNVPKAVADIYAGMFGLNPQTITDKTRNYQKTDAEGLTTAKQFLLKNANNDFARLPETKDGFGKGTFLPRNVMNALYTDGKLTGTLKDYIDLIRQKPVKPIYRDAVGQTIRGLLNLHIRNRMFEDLVTTTPERLRGGAKFSKTTAYQNLFQALPFEKVKDDFSTLNNFRWGAILQATLRGSGVSPIDMKTSEGRQRFKDYAVSSGMISKFPKDFWRSMQGTTENLLKDETKKFGEAVKETREFVESLVEDPDVVIDESQFRGYTGNLPFRSVKEVNDWIAETEANGGVFAKDSQLFSDMLKKENPTAKRLPMEKALNDPAFIKRQENSINGLKKVFEIFQDAMKTPEGIAFVAAIMSSSGASQNHFIRKSAPWKFYQKGYLDQAIREEHTLPASLIGKYLFMSALEGTVSSDFKNVKKNFFQGALLKTNDDRLKGFKPTGGRYDYVESTPEGWKITDNIWARYFNINVANTEGGINPQSIMLANNKSVFDLFNVTPSGLKLNEQGIKDLPKVEKALDEVVPKSMQSKTKLSAQQNIFNQSVLDNALNQARRPNAPVKKIRVFDFDDTLARSKSKVLYTVPNVEGGFSEGATNLKAIFMVGGPGAGKTNVGKGLQLGRRGYKVVNQDIALEAMKAESGLPAKESDYTAEQRSLRSKLGAAARKAAVAKFDKYAAAGNGMVIDGTGASYNATTKKIKALQDQGFEVHMVVATTPLETAIERNKARVERSLPDFVVEKTYESVQESLKKYREDFGDRLYEINTETIEYGKPLPNDFLQQVYAGINANKVGKVDASNFATEYDVLESQGAEFDFREFSRVIEGEKGPLFSVAEKIAAARGTDDVFILTARPADAAKPIQEFMKANGIDIPLQNITGLGDGTAAAKGRWIAGKAAEGYNDFYFADDAIKNVQAVKEVLSQVDVKSKVQQAKFSKTKVFDKVFNDIIEQKTGIESYKQFSAAKAKTVGASKGKFTFFTTPSAEDFLGLLYKTLGKGKVGDAQMAFYKENLLDPFNRAEMAISQAKVAAGRDYKALKKQFKSIPKTLEKETGISKYTYQHAIRTYIWDSQGLEVPGLSRRDQKRLTDFIKADPELQAFADQLVTIQKGKPYPKPNKDWTAGNITTDVISGINKVNRAEYLQEWQENVDIIFSEKNMNKLEAAFGAKYVEALKDSLRAMKSGSNRPLGGDRVSNGILDWLNNSVGAIMFLNTRSAVLQTISAVNFINWGDNNILKAGKAFANQKQFWSDFLTLMNSDYLLERRDGLKINVSESEIADAVEGSKNKVNAAISFLLNKGFVFTRYADSFAIASGGATFYRNRIESLVEQGMDRKLAEQQAFEDFRLIAEENQQSSSPMRISQQQRSLIGRIILQFGNTQLQYVRIQKRAVQDLVNGRGDWRANISKIVYYGAIQNLMFNALQSGLAWALFDDDEDDEELTEKNKEQKLTRTLNGAIDSQLKGLGIQGAVVAGVKNALLTIAEQADKKSPKFEEALDDLLSIAPSLGSKIRKLKSAARTVSWNRKDIKEEGFSMDNPAYLAGAQTISAVFNIPLDRAVMKMNNMRNILNPATENWQKVALALGWSTWDVGLPYFGLAEDKPVLTETEKQTQKLFDLNKSDQVKMLLDLGLTKKEIRALTKEDQRVDQIIKLQNKKKDGKNKS